MATVLVVDDDRLTVEALTVLLRKAGHVLLPAVGAAQALAWLEKIRPDILLLDLKMPGLDGFGLLEKLGQDPRASATPVLIMTGQGDALEGRAFPPNVAKVLLKPQDTSAILKAIEKTLAAPH